MKQVGKRHILLAVLGSLLIGSAFAGVNFMDYGYTPSRDDGYTPRIGGNNSQVLGNFSNINKWSDLAVRARVVSVNSAFIPCCDSMATRVAENFKDAPGPSRLEETVTLRLVETLKGTAPETITIKAQKPGGTVKISGDDELAMMEFEVGQEYVLFLIERAGSYYQVQGYENGMWKLNRRGEATQIGTGDVMLIGGLTDKIGK